MQGKPQYRTINEIGDMGDVRWEAEIRKWDGGRFEVIAIRTRTALGTSIATFRPRQHSYAGIADARREVERLVVEIAFDPYDRAACRHGVA